MTTSPETTPTSRASSTDDFHLDHPAHRGRSRRLLALAGVVAVGSTALVANALPTAAAPLTTRCTGEAVDVTIPGDLVVPAGEACALFGSAVQGSVTVRQGASLLLADGSSVTGGAVVARDGFLDMIGSSIDGPVEGRSAFALVVDASSVGQDLTMRGTAGPFPPLLFTTGGAAVGGNVDARSGDVILVSTTISGSVTSRNAQYTDLLDSTVLGDLTVRTNVNGSVVCESEIDGNALFQGNGDGLQIGGSGALLQCAGASYWGGDVVVQNNAGPVYGIDVSNNIVRGSLSGTRNDPAPTGSQNRVRGGVSGQFAELVPAVATASRQAAPTSRIDEARAALDARRGVVVDVVEDLGEAELEPATAEDLAPIG